jgi:iron complex outermembrane receptor protein
VRNGESKLYYVDFEATGEIYQFDHGAVEAAVGSQYRNEEFSDEVDPVTESDAVVGVGGTSADGSRDVGAVFAELAIPVLSSLEFQLAGRYDGYSDFGGTFNPKLGVRWQPLSSLLLRANGGTGFKAPALHELYSGDIVAVDRVFDPATGDVHEVIIIASGNPDLDAEKSRNYGLGLVWDVTDAWNLTLDYWRIKVEDAVNNDPQFYVDNEAFFTDNVIRDENGNIERVLSPFQNIAEIKTWGVDLDTGLTWGTAAAGDFRFGVVGTYLGSFEREPVPGAGFEELAGKDGRPHWRGQGVLSWSKADFEGSLTVNYIGGYDRRLEGRDDDHVDAWTTVDAQLSWYPHPVSSGKLTLGIDNLFDEKPPEDPYFQGWPFFNRALHNARGRYVYLGYSHTF